MHTADASKEVKTIYCNIEKELTVLCWIVQTDDFKEG
jgi:hypothetical protein